MLNYVELVTCFCNNCLVSQECDDRKAVLQLSAIQTYTGERPEVHFMPSNIAGGFSTTLCEFMNGDTKEGGRARRGNFKWLRRSRACGPANSADDNTLTDDKRLDAGMLTSRLAPIEAGSLLVENEHEFSPEF
jgi:hypothetical protein